MRLQGQRGCTLGRRLGDIGQKPDFAAAIGICARAVVGYAHLGRDSDIAAIECATDACRRRGVDDVVVGVQQPHTGLAPRAARIDGDALDLQFVARSFNPAATAAERTATGGDLAVGRGDAAAAVDIAPQHHGAAVTLLCGAGVDAGAGAHGDAGGLVNAVAALPVTTDQDRAAAGGAAGVNMGGVDQVDVVAQQAGAAALAAAATHTQHAVADDGQPPLAGCVRQWLGVARLLRRGGTQMDAAALGAAGVKAGVVDFDIAAGADLDLATLAGRRAVWRGRCGFGRDVDLAFQLHLPSGVDVERAALKRRAHIDTAALTLGEGGGLNLNAAGVVCRRERCSLRKCGGCHSTGLRRGGADGAAVDHHRGTDFDLASRSISRGVGADAASVIDLFAGRQDDATTLLLKASGFHRATVFHHAADQAVHGLGAENNQTAWRLHRVAVLNQGLNLAGLDADAGQAVVAVKFQVNGFAGCERDRAHLGNDGALIAHLRCQQCDVPAQSRFDFTFVDDAGGAAIALKPIFTRQEIGIAHAVGCGHEATHVQARIFAKVNTGRIGQDHLAIGRNAAKNLAGVRTHHAVQRHAVCARLLELHFGVFAHVKGLPINGGPIAALQNHHIGATGVDLGLTRADLAALGQGVGWWCRLGVGALRQQTPQNCSNG